mmetsp:Transcript_93725/g.303490  ORF Transcript_93725/g.303490 Transcript_93725/m.303490 type:complete len:228 (+) Transcript_93725:1046-1729(+)
MRVLCHIVSSRCLNQLVFRFGLQASQLFEVVTLRFELAGGLRVRRCRQGYSFCDLLEGFFRRLGLLLVGLFALCFSSELLFGRHEFGFHLCYLLVLLSVVGRILYTSSRLEQHREVAQSHSGPGFQPTVFRSIILGTFRSNALLIRPQSRNQQFPCLALGRLGPIEEPTNLLGCEVLVLLALCIERLCHEGHLEHLQAERLIFHHAAHDQSIHPHFAGLADAEHPVH